MEIDAGVLTDVSITQVTRNQSSNVDFALVVVTEILDRYKTQSCVEPYPKIDDVFCKAKRHVL